MKSKPRDLGGQPRRPHRPAIQRLACYALIREGEKILLCRLSSEIHSNHAWTLPGGGVEFGEHPLEAGKREVKEETGLDIELGDLATINSMVYRFPGPPRHAIRLVFKARVVGGHLKHEASGTTDRCAWFTFAEAKELPLVDLAELGLELAFGKS